MSKLGPKARSILDAGRAGDDPTPEDRARVKRALMRSIAAGGALGATSTVGAAAKGAAVVGAVGQATSLGLGAKLLGVVVLVGAASTGVFLERGRNPVSPPPHTSTINAPPVNVAPATTAPIEARPASPIDTASTNADPPIVAPALVAGGRVGEPAAVERPGVAVPPTRPLPRAAGSDRSEDSPSERPREQAPVDVVVPAEDPLAAETRHLREAHGALQSGDPKKALALLDEPQGGQLGQERAAARVLALCQLGRGEEAESARAAFLREHPRSPLADRVRNGCSNAPSK